MPPIAASRRGFEGCSPISDSRKPADVEVHHLLIIQQFLAGALGRRSPPVARTNPAVVTKFADRGSWQSIGLVTDVESFLRELALVIETGAHG